ncbi:multi-sensor hybrid histidine kinase [Calothrix sp. NIES-4071]|nr:multi-sensor hybrid histidine kinase [Calothrix sp. NIES-4071]BAZ61358.1 multi-sensor hybrid histidine kinase [Calothrix sp. NIES-4105]
MTTFLDSITDGVIILDTQWHLIFINDQGAKFFDKSQEELISKNIYDIWTEAGATVFNENCQSAVTEKVPRHWQQFSTSLNTWLEFYIYPSENGLVLLTQELSTHQQLQQAQLNISNPLEYQLLYQTVKLAKTDGAALNQMIQHLIAEAALRHTNAQFAKILESITDGVVAFDQDWRYIFVNEKATQILQKYEGELLGKNIWQVYPELVNTLPFQKCHEVADTGTSIQFEYYYTQLNLWLEHNIYPSVNGISIYFRDITERKLREAERHALFEREQNARIQIEIAEQKYAFLSEAGRILATSLDTQITLSTVLRLVIPFLADYCLVQKLGLDGSSGLVAAMHSHVEKQKLVDELANHYQNHIINLTSLTARVFQSREPILIRELDYKTVTEVMQDEEMLNIYEQLNPKSCMMVPLIARGQIFGTLFLATSESERRYTESDLVLAVDLACRAAMAIDNSQLYYQAQESNRLKDEFLATMSHEIRTPLHAILGWAQTLARRNTDTVVQKGVETIERNAKNLLKIVYDLLDVSRIITGKLNLDAATVDFAMVTQEAISSLQLAAEAKSIHIDTYLDQNINPVRGDAERLRQIVWNLISNAIKFTPKGGSVTIRLFQVQQYVQLEVSDTGQGIGANFLPYIYDRFRQADGSFTRVHGGLGLGLSLVRHLVEMHGGTIDIYSAGEGQGTTATVRLPI